MRVVVDFTGSMSTNTGGATYPFSMLPRWDRIEEDHLRAVYSSGQVPSELSSLECVVEVPPHAVSGLSQRIVDLHLGFRRVLVEAEAQVAYFPGNFVPLGLPADIPVVVAVRSTIHFDFPAQGGLARTAVQRFAARYAVHRAQRIIVPSSKAADALMRHTGALRRQLVVVPHGVELDLFRPGDSHDREPDLLVFVSRPWDYKGLHTVVRSLREVDRDPHSRISPRLVVVDGGLPAAEVADWMALCEKLQVAERVKFVGRVDHVALSRLYRQASALVLPSATESFGNAYLEAAAAGCLVIGSAGLALDDLSGADGIRVPVHDHVALARAIDQVLTMDASERAERSHLLRTVAERYSWDETLMRTREVLAEVV